MLVDGKGEKGHTIHTRIVPITRERERERKRENEKRARGEGARRRAGRQWRGSKGAGRPCVVGGISYGSVVVVVEASEGATNVVTIVSVGYGFSTDRLFDIVPACG